MSRSHDEERGEAMAREIEKAIVNHQQVHEFIHRTVNCKTGVPTDFIVGDDGVRSSFVMIERGPKIDIPEGTWRFLDLETESGFEFARYALRKQMEQWGVVFLTDHLTMEQEAARPRRIKVGDPFWTT